MRNYFFFLLLYILAIVRCFAKLLRNFSGVYLKGSGTFLLLTETQLHERCLSKYSGPFRVPTETLKYITAKGLLY